MIYSTLVLAGALIGFIARGLVRGNPIEDTLRSRAVSIRSATDTETSNMREALQIIANPPKTCGDPLFMAEIAQEALAKAERQS